MRQHLANVILASTTLSGCSLIYDTNELPAIDAPIDAPIDSPPPPDADPSMFTITSVTPTQIFEGQGDPDGGSRPAMIVINGSNLDGSANPTVTITLVDGSPAPVEVVQSALRVDGQFAYLAVPVRVPVNVDETGAGGPIGLEITVGLDVPGVGRLEKKLLGLSVQMLPELDGAVTLASRLAPYEYSRVAGSITTTAGDHPLRVHSWSSMQIDGITGLAASGATPGPGGGAGGGTAAGGQAGNKGGGASGGDGGNVGVSGLLGGAGGNGKNATWSGDERLPTLGPANTHRSSGGGSGGGGVTALGAGGAGGPGGGGGGTVQLRADGHLSIPNAFSAAGAAGVDVSGNGGIGGNGTGGSVLVQAGGTLDVPVALNVAGGGGGAPAGKIRFDAPALSINTAIDGYRGPSFVTGTPTIVAQARPMLSVLGTPISTAQYLLFNDVTSTGLFPLELGPAETPFTLGEDLRPGLNHVCLLVSSAEKESDTRTCIDLVYVRPAPSTSREASPRGR
jgi:hypothetical protein